MKYGIGAISGVESCAAPVQRLSILHIGHVDGGLTESWAQLMTNSGYITSRCADGISRAIILGKFPSEYAANWSLTCAGSNGNEKFLLQTIPVNDSR
jgi:hypothetical protein